MAQLQRLEEAVFVSLEFNKITNRKLMDSLFLSLKTIIQIVIKINMVVRQILNKRQRPDEPEWLERIPSEHRKRFRYKKRDQAGMPTAIAFAAGGWFTSGTNPALETPGWAHFCLL